MSLDGNDQDGWYHDTVAKFGSAIVRLTSVYERDADRRRDLAQDIHIALWRSYSHYRGDCSARTWVYRVAHNVGASHILSQRRARTAQWVSIEEAESLPSVQDLEAEFGQAQLRDQMMNLIQQLKLPDRQIMHLYLEGLEAAAISEITQFSPGNVATKISRLKAALVRNHQQGQGS